MDLACTGNTNYTCDPGKLCCFNGCSPVCTTGITPTPLCPAVKLKATNGSSGLLGAYVPQCKENGEFSRIQCHEGYCWCVDGQTGKATTQPSRSQPVCNTTTTGRYIYSSYSLISFHTITLYIQKYTFTV